VALAPYYSDLAIDSSGERYMTPAKWDQMMDNFINWKFNVNAGANNLSNINILTASEGNISRLGSNLDVNGKSLTGILSLTSTAAVIGTLTATTLGGGLNANGNTLSNLGAVTFATGTEIAQQAWQPFTLINSWTDAGPSSGYGASGYYRDKQKCLHVRMYLTVPPSLQTITILPVGYRPASAVHLIGWNTTNATLMRLLVVASGEIIVVSAPTWVAGHVINVTGVIPLQ
jgi:hypothetical protein